MNDKSCRHDPSADLKLNQKNDGGKWSACVETLFRRSIEMKKEQGKITLSVFLTEGEILPRSELSMRFLFRTILFILIGVPLTLPSLRSDESVSGFQRFRGTHRAAIPVGEAANSSETSDSSCAAD